MNTEEIKAILIAKFGPTCLTGENLTLQQAQLFVHPDFIERVCLFLRDTEGLYFDSLSCLTGIDNGAQAATMEVIYHLYSIPYHHFLVLKVILSRENPTIDSVAHIWRTADWHEREAFDFFGIRFNNHPDLRRILLPADWEGFPLRKDYEEQEYYHGIKVK